MPTKIKARDLQLADVIEITTGGYRTATVKQIQDGYATLFRPYVHTDDFSYTGGVICYIGIETFQIRMDESELTLWARKTLK